MNSSLPPNSPPQPPKGFSTFAWAIVMFCFPILLSPLGVLLSGSLIKNPALTSAQVSWMSNFFWIYPVALALIARTAYLLHARHTQFARGLLIVSAVLFYGILVYIFRMGFN